MGAINQAFEHSGRIDFAAVSHAAQPQRIVGDLLSAEINEKQARSIKYQLTHRQAAIGQGCR
jgi:hypothetical protein